MKRFKKVLIILLLALSMAVPAYAALTIDMIIIGEQCTMPEIPQPPFNNNCTYYVTVQRGISSSTFFLGEQSTPAKLCIQRNARIECYGR